MRTWRYRMPIDEMEVGDKAVYTRTFTEGDVAMFVGVTGDANPYHTDESFARRTRFERRIVPGLLTASMATHIGGDWAFLATEMTFKYLAPVCVGDTVTCEVEVVEVNREKNRARLLVRCRDEDGKELLVGEIAGFPSPRDL